MRITRETLLVFRDLLQAPACGAEIMREHNLKSGTVYPILKRLEAAGLAKSKTESEDPSDLQRPRKTIYSLTAKGRAQATAALEELR